MTELNKATEEKILEAAQDIFTQKGMTGARMQEIADKAGINKALLHYYYRTKEKLFFKVFKIAIGTFIPKVVKIMSETDIPFFDRLRNFIIEYYKILLKNQFIPQFVIHELNRNPENLINVFKEQNINADLYNSIIQKEIEKGVIKPGNPREIIANILSLIIFPIVAQPILRTILFNGDNNQYQQFLKDRMVSVPEVIINSIKAEGYEKNSN